MMVVLWCSGAPQLAQDQPHPQAPPSLISSASLHPHHQRSKPPFSTKPSVQRHDGHVFADSRRRRRGASAAQPWELLPRGLERRTNHLAGPCPAKQARGALRLPRFLGPVLVSPQPRSSQEKHPGSFLGCAEADNVYCPIRNLHRHPPGCPDLGRGCADRPRSLVGDRRDGHHRGPGYSVPRGYAWQQREKGFPGR
ncbi:unnamed protein product [Ectocarpus fasciculatus]